MIRVSLMDSVNFAARHQPRDGIQDTCGEPFSIWSMYGAVSLPQLSPLAASRARKNGRFSLQVFSVILLLSAVLATLIFTLQPAASALSNFETSSVLAETTSACLSVTNEYIKTMGPIGEKYSYTSDSVVIIDIHKVADISATFPDSLDSNAFVVSWMIDGQKQSEVESTINWVPESLGKHFVQATKTDSVTGAVLGICETTLVVKYVRREIRELTDSDRETFFNALATMYVVT